MALDPFDRPSQRSRHSALLGTERTIYVSGNDEENWSWGEHPSFLLAKVSAFQRSTRIFDHASNLDSVALHRSHAHPNEIPSCGNTDNGVGLHSNDPISRSAIERWKIGHGRKKAWRTAPRLRFTDKHGVSLFRCLYQRIAGIPPRSMPLQDPELISFITRAPLSCGIPTVMLEHCMVPQFRNQMSPKPCAVKKLAKRIGVPTSTMSRPRTKLKPMADSLINDDGADGVGFHNEEDDDANFEAGPSYGYLGNDVCPGVGDVM